MQAPLDRKLDCRGGPSEWGTPCDTNIEAASLRLFKGRYSWLGTFQYCITGATEVNAHCQASAHRKVQGVNFQLDCGMPLNTKVEFS